MDLRQKLHLEPASGWLNDPNGLCWFAGAYHVYFQYAPHADGSGGKCWGHWQSPDLLHWTFTGIVLRPDHPDDRSGVYSGCGFVRGDTLYLFYTGSVKEPGEHDYITSGRGANVMLVTTKDGHHMSEKRTLLRNADYPDYCSCHVRDPKVWEEDGRFRMVLGARTLDDRGCVLYYTSDDLEHWTYEKTVYGSDGSYMWECPDDFVLDGKRFLSVSPQGIPHEKYRFQNVYSSGYFRISGDVPADYREWDCGFDFYAPQTFLTPDGRRLLIGWMGIGDIPYTNPTATLGWQHCLTLPRELTLREDSVILQNPARELAALRSSATKIAGSVAVPVTLPFEFWGFPDGDFTLELRDVLRLSCQSGEVHLTVAASAGYGRTERFARLPACREVRMIADTSSAEIYLNGGEVVFSTRYYPPDTAQFLSGISGSVYELNGIEVTSDGNDSGSDR
ncbi:MAG: glycoside hydrolase family 32 protein [Oscillospiraceae bacterium]|nr:glycoside hydrolase family 32 protein [Oscillospiraceae bacterium]